MKKGNLKRKLAAVMAACMIATSIQSSTIASTNMPVGLIATNSDAETISTDSDAQPEVPMEDLKPAETVPTGNGQESTEAEEIATPSVATPSVATVSDAAVVEFNSDELLSAVEKAIQSGKAVAEDKLPVADETFNEFADAEWAKVDIDAETPEKVKLTVYAEIPEEAKNVEDYQLTGEERVIYAFTNSSNDLTKGVQLKIGNKVSDIIVLPAKDIVYNSLYATDEIQSSGVISERSVETLPAAEESNEASITEEETTEEETAETTSLWAKIGNFFSGNIAAHASEAKEPGEAVENTYDYEVFSDGTIFEKTAEGELLSLNISAPGLLKSNSLLTKIQENIAFLSEDENGNPKETIFTSTVVLATGTVNDIAPLADNSENFRVELFDYNKDQINSYLGRQSNKLRFGPEGDGIYNAYQNYQSKRYNIIQNIPKYILKDNFDLLYPNDYSSGTTKNGITYYPTVLQDFFTVEGNHYSYDSTESGGALKREWKRSGHKGSWNYIKDGNGHYILSKDPTVLEEDGFWPFIGNFSNKEDSENNSNKYFGMHLSFDFYLPENGMNGNDPLKFTFSGDDDAWVYLTKLDENMEPIEGQKKLVLDIGGIHGRMDGTIDFNTGEINYTNEKADSAESKYAVITNLLKDNDETINVEGLNDKHGKDKDDIYYTAKEYLYTEKTADQKGMDDDYIQYMNLPKESKGTSYRLDFYLLERGAGDSNCSFDFTLPVIPKNGVTVTKAVTGANVPDSSTDFPFEVVTADSLEDLKNGGNSQTFNLQAGSSETIELNEGTYFYVQETNNQGATSTNWEASAEPVKEDDTPVTIKGNNVYQMGSTTGILLTCTNEFGEVKPTTEKTAIRQENETSDLYDITLKVNGASKTTISSGGETQGNANIVFVIDESGSMSESRMGTAKAAMQALVKQVPGSKYSIVGFSDEGIQGEWDYDNWTWTWIWYAKNYYSDASDEFYTIRYPWTTIDENTDINQAYTVQEGDGGTHAAGGFLGAQHVLEKAGTKTNQFVVFLTDGAASYAISTEKNQEGNYKVFGNGSSDTEDGDCGRVAKERAQVIKNTGATIYTIMTGSSAPQWLKDSASGSDKCYSVENANDTEQLSKVFEDIGEEIQETTTTPIYVTTVTDELSSHVEFVLDASGLPQFSLNGTSLQVNKTLTGYELFKDGAQVGTVTGKTIRWTINSNLGKDQSTALTYKVQAVGDVLSDYPDTPDAGTGTHADNNEKGYHSNGAAYVNYKDSENGTEQEPVDFPKPVVRPVQKTAPLKITKEIIGAEGKDADFNFKITFDNTDGIEKPAKATQNPNGTYEFSLRNGEEVTFNNILIGTGYTLEETNAADVTESWNDDTHKYVHESTVGTGDGTIVENENNVVVTNTYKVTEYQPLITVTKNVVNPEGVQVPAQFTFGTDLDSVEIKENNNKWNLIEEKNFTLTEDQTVTLRIPVGTTLNLTETDGTAWSTTVQKNSEVALPKNWIEVDGGDQVTFTNYYHADHIVIEKNVEGAEAKDTFKFNVTLYSDGRTISKDNLDTTLQWNIDQDGSRATTTVDIKAGESKKITSVPQYIKSYTVEEDQATLTSINEALPDGIQVSLKNVVSNPEGSVSGSEINVNMDSSTKDPIVTFTNEYKKTFGTVELQKILEDGATADQDQTFAFIISNGAQTFPVTVTVPENASQSNTLQLTLPVGTYTIEEMNVSKYDFERFTINGVIGTSFDVKGDGTVQIVAYNSKSDDRYFTDSSCITNKVEDGEFKPDVSDGTTKPEETVGEKIMAIFKKDEDSLT